MCNKTVDDCPWMLGAVPDHLKARGMCNEAVRNNPYTLKYVPDKSKTQVMWMMWRAKTHACWNMFPIGLGPKRCALGQ